MVTGEDIITSGGMYGDRAKYATPIIRANTQELAGKIERLFLSFGKHRAISSGFRTKDANQAAGGANNSWHLAGCAVDLFDKDGEFGLFCLAEQTLLEHFGLYLEDPRWTRKRQKEDGTWDARWVHLQTKPPPSGRRVFRPAGPMPR